MDQPIALVTGASGEIGRAISLKLAAMGYAIWAHYNSDLASIQSLQQALAARHASCEICRFDIRDSDSIKQSLGPQLKSAAVEALVLNAGMIRMQQVAFQSNELVDEVIDTNLKGFFNVLSPVVRGMIKNRRGSIVAISSVAAIKGIPTYSCYAAAKAGLLGAVRSLARELGGHGIRVNAVLPGFIDTKMNRTLDAKAIATQIPSGRIGTVDDVANIVAFLAGPESSYVNGAEIVVAGGLDC